MQGNVIWDSINKLDLYIKDASSVPTWNDYAVERPTELN